MSAIHKQPPKVAANNNYITSSGKKLLDLTSNFESEVATLIFTEEYNAVFRQLPLLLLCSWRLIPPSPIPFLYSVRGSLSSKSPSSLCLSLWDLVYLCWISCPTTKTEPLGKPNSQSHPPPASHTHAHVFAYRLDWWIHLLMLHTKQAGPLLPGK